MKTLPHRYHVRVRVDLGQGAEGVFTTRVNTLRAALRAGWRRYESWDPLAVEVTVIGASRRRLREAS